MPRFIAALNDGAETQAAVQAVGRVQGVNDVIETRTFPGLIVTGEATARNRVAALPQVAEVHEDIQAFPATADRGVESDFRSKVSDLRGGEENQPPAVMVEPTRAGDPQVRTDGGQVLTTGLPELSDSEQFPATMAGPIENATAMVSQSGINRLHERGQRADGVTLVIVDTGVCEDQFAAERRLDGMDTTGDGNAWNDYLGHGSMSAGISAGGPETQGVSTGMAPGGDVFPIRSSLAGSEIIQAQDRIVQLAEETGRPVVVNNSWAFKDCQGSCSHPVTQAVRNAADHPLVYQVFAAGNQGNRCGQECDGSAIGINGPNSLPNVLTVGATGRDGGSQRVQPYSSRGSSGNVSCGSEKPDLMAPAFGTLPWGCRSRNLGNGGGTSAAAPQVAGAVAVAVAEGENPPAQRQVFQTVRKNAAEVGSTGFDGCAGNGNLRAVESADIPATDPIQAGLLGTTGGKVVAGAVAVGVGGAILRELWNPR